MQTYCLGCQIHTDNICPIKLIMTNKEFKGKSKCADCMWNWKVKIYERTRSKKITKQFRN